MDGVVHDVVVDDSGAEPAGVAVGCGNLAWIIGGYLNASLRFAGECGEVVDGVEFGGRAVG